MKKRKINTKAFFYYWLHLFKNYILITFETKIYLQHIALKYFYCTIFSIMFYWLFHVPIRSLLSGYHTLERYGTLYWTDPYRTENMIWIGFRPLDVFLHKISNFICKNRNYQPLKFRNYILKKYIYTISYKCLFGPKVSK